MWEEKSLRPPAKLQRRMSKNKNTTLGKNLLFFFQCVRKKDTLSNFINHTSEFTDIFGILEDLKNIRLFLTIIYCDPNSRQFLLELTMVALVVVRKTVHQFQCPWAKKLDQQFLNSHRVQPLRRRTLCQWYYRLSMWILQKILRLRLQILVLQHFRLHDMIIVFYLEVCMKIRCRR